MKDLSEFLKAFSMVMWPLLLFTIVFTFRKEIRKSFGKITSIEAGDIKVNMGKDETTTLALNDLAKK